MELGGGGCRSLAPRDRWARDRNFWILREEKVGGRDSWVLGGSGGWEPGLQGPSWELGTGVGWGGAGLGGP